MTIQSVIHIVSNKVIDSFTRLDLWFDERADVLNHTPLDGGWNGIQILEHVMLTSHYLLVLIDKGTSKSLKRAEISLPETDWTQYKLSSDAFDQIAKSQSFVWIRPEHMEPKGEMSFITIREKLKEQKDRCIENLHKLRNGEGTLCLTTMSVNDLGKLDVYQYVYFVALHIDRHLEQLERNKKELL